MKLLEMSNNFRSSFARHHPSAFLLAAQLLLLVFYAVFERYSQIPIVLNILADLVLLLILWVISTSPVIQWIAWALAIPAFSLPVFGAFWGIPSLLGWSALFEAALHFYAAGSLIAYMLRDNRVTRDELFAAGGTFTLVAWGYAYLYLVVQEWVPGSYINGGHPGQPLTFLELLFLSFTNLSATGLGDILPVSAFARVIAMLEQFSGVGYITVVVSRLIGLTIQNQGAVDM